MLHLGLDFSAFYSIFVNTKFIKTLLTAIFFNQAIKTHNQKEAQRPFLINKKYEHTILR